MIVKVKCPYCGFENQVNIEPEFYYPKQVITCDVDEGGCERDFVLDVETGIRFKTLKIEGEE